MYDAVTESSEEDYIPAEQFTAPSNKKGYAKPKRAPVGKAKPPTEKKANPKAKNKSRPKSNKAPKQKQYNGNRKKKPKVEYEDGYNFVRREIDLS